MTVEHRTGPIVRDCRPEDLVEAYRIRRLAFGGPPGPDPIWLGNANRWHGHVAELDGLLCGFVRVSPYGQFFGGRPVPMGAVASMSVDPHARGHGIASRLMTAALAGMRADGLAVSTLYATVARLYRNCGYEVVGGLHQVELPLSALREVPAPGREITLRWPGPHDVWPMHQAYLAAAAAVDGMLDRTGPGFHQPDMLLRDLKTLAVGEGPDRPPAGYLLGTKDTCRLDVHDLVAADVDVARALLRSLGSWSGLVDRVRLRLIDDLPALLIGELASQHTVSVNPFLLRIVDLPAAVSARGWPAARQLRDGLAVELELADPHAPWQSGRHRLVVDSGTVRCEPPGAGVPPDGVRGDGVRGDGPVRLGPRALAAWYAGALGTRQLARAGLLAGPPEGLAVLDALTGAPGPLRMADDF